MEQDRSTELRNRRLFQEQALLVEEAQARKGVMAQLCWLMLYDVQAREMEKEVLETSWQWVQVKKMLMKKMVWLRLLKSQHRTQSRYQRMKCCQQSVVVFVVALVLLEPQLGYDETAVEKEVLGSSLVLLQVQEQLLKYCRLPNQASRINLPLQVWLRVMLFLQVQQQQQKYDFELILQLEEVLRVQVQPFYVHKEQSSVQKKIFKKKCDLSVVC